MDDGSVAGNAVAERQEGISIIIPAFNESGNLARVVPEMAEALQATRVPFELIIVDDGSTDGTREEALVLEEQHRYVFVEAHPENRGMGAAVATGFARSGFRWVSVIPADGQFDCLEIGRLLEKRRAADVVVGFRERRSDPWYRTLATMVNRLLVRLAFGLMLKDTTWVKLFRSDVLQRVGKLTPGFFWETEVLVKAKRLGFKFAEAGLSSKPRLAGESKGRSLRRALRTYSYMARCWLEMRKWPGVQGHGRQA